MCDKPDSDELVMPRRRRFDRAKSCVKCKEQKGHLVIRHAVYCKACFSTMLTHKFRHTLYSDLNMLHQTLEPSANALIGFSGGIGSTVLLDLVERNYMLKSKPGREQKRSPTNLTAGGSTKWKTVFVGYVETCAAYPSRKDRTDEIRRLIANHPEYQLILLRIEDAFDPHWWSSLGKEPLKTGMCVDLGLGDLVLGDSAKSSPIESLQCFLGSLPSSSAVATVLSHLTRVLLLHTAESLSCSHLLLGNTLTSLSISLISSISSGGGFTLSEEREEHWMSIKAIKPLRDITNKECAAWLHWSHLSVLGGGVTLRTDQGINCITQDFIVGLDKDFPSTVSTISRTCAKVIPKSSESPRLCAFCQRPTQGHPRDWTSRVSVLSKSMTRSQTVSSLATFICYGCHASFTSRGSRGMTRSNQSPVPLPVWVSSSSDISAWRLGDARRLEGTLERGISEFLLGD